MVSTLAPSARQNAASRSTAAGSVPSRRRQDAPAVDEQFGEAGVGAGILGAGDRMRGHEMHARGQMRRHVAHDRALDRADVGDDRAGFEMRADLGCATAPQAPTGMQTITRSAPSTAAALVSTTWSAMPSSATRLRVAAERAVATIVLHDALRARRARDRGADQADADQRQAVEEGLCHAVTPSSPMNSASAFDHEPVRLLAADRHAQRIRQLDRPRRGAGSGRAW